MADTTQHLADVLDAHAPVDNTARFAYLLDLRERAWEIIHSSLRLREDRACADVRTIRDLQGNVAGEMTTFTGDGSPVDWIVRSWIGRPKAGFTNIHLTCWLDATVDVPHLGFALGTAPDVFCYCDFLPRVEACTDYDYVERYLQPMNEAWVSLRRDARYKVFNPVHLYTRSTLSPIAICGLLPFDNFRAVVEPLMLTYVRAWVALVQAARPVPADQQPAIAHRDHVLRRTIVEKDPANVLADRMLGVPMRERLVRILWGAEREPVTRTEQP